MTMFSKGTWTIFKVQKPEGSNDTLQEIFKKGLADSGTTYIPLFSINKTIHEQITTLGLAPYFHPRLGDEEEVVQNFANGKTSSEDLDSFIQNQNLDEWTYDAKAGTFSKTSVNIKSAPYWEPDADKWMIGSGVVGAWMMLFEYIDARDSASKKEKIAYDYGAPFKLQNGETKKSISESVADLNTFTRKHYQIVMDLNQGMVWVNSAATPVVTQTLAVLEGFGFTVTTPDTLVEDISADQLKGLTSLYTDSSIKDEVIMRQNSMKLHGPDGIEPNENATMEKILKAFCAFTEHDGYHIGLSTPIGILLNDSMPSPTVIKTNFEAVELLESDGGEDMQITEADLMFTEYIDKTSKTGETRQILSKRFSVHASPNMFHKELPGVIVRGINIEDFKHTIKQHTKATDAAPTIAEFWKMYYDSLKTAVFVYFQTIKGLGEE